MSNLAIFTTLLNKQRDEEVIKERCSLAVENMCIVDPDVWTRLRVGVDDKQNDKDRKDVLTLH